MKRSTIAAFALMCSASFAFAGGGAPVPPKQEGGDASGRPAALLDDAKCQTVWSQTDHESDVLSEDEAAPFIVNFKMVDTDGKRQALARRVQAGLQGRPGAGGLRGRQAGPDRLG